MVIAKSPKLEDVLAGLVMKETTDYREREQHVHVYGPHAVCDTERRGSATPGGRSKEELVLDASDGFIPLWDEGTILRWRFQERSMKAFANPEAAKNAIRMLLGEAMLAWGDAAPIKLTEHRDRSDFEIVMRRSDDCEGGGCVLASAFFPDGGRHKLTLYPKLFTQTREEIVETLVHEIGHIFGLRHFFALVEEKAWRAELFGEHNPFSIMNYGSLSKLTDADRSDLKRLYALVWSRQLKVINTTPIKLVTPFSKT